MVKPDRSVIVFDFDGVIVNSLQHCLNTWQEAGANITLTEYVQRFEGNINKAHKPVAAIDFFTAYEPRVPKLTLFPGIAETVSHLAGKHTLSINSSTLSKFINHVLAKYNLNHHFDSVLGNDAATSKVEKLNMVFERYQITPDQCIMVTDTLGDLREATEANVKTIAVTWGFHDVATLQQGNPTKIAAAPQEIPPHVAAIFEAS